MQENKKVESTEEPERISQHQIQIGHAIFKKCRLSSTISYEEQVYFLNSYSIRIVYAIVIFETTIRMMIGNPLPVKANHIGYNFWELWRNPFILMFN
jgi:hypothetical protein